jgi:hypothetical protein
MKELQNDRVRYLTTFENIAIPIRFRDFSRLTKPRILPSIVLFGIRRHSSYCFYQHVCVLLKIM